MAGNLNFTGMHIGLPNPGFRVREPQQRINVEPAPHSENDLGEIGMETDSPDEWEPDAKSFRYLSNLMGKTTGHPHARKVAATRSWLRTQRKLPTYKRDRLLAGHAVEDAIPDYTTHGDDNGFFQISNFKNGRELAIQHCIREHIKFLRSKEGSMAEFPTGRVTNERRKQFLDNRSNPDTPDLGSTIEKCCPDVDGTACNPWNQTFIDSVARDFVLKVAEGWYTQHALPQEAQSLAKMRERVKTCVYSMVKKRRRELKYSTANQIMNVKASDRYMQRRRVKHAKRLLTCDESPAYRNFYGLLKVVGPEGNSDEETDNEAGVDPLPILVYPLKWRSREYANLLHALDVEANRRETSSLLRAGPAPARRNLPRANRLVRATDMKKKHVPVTCPAGKPEQFYDKTFVRKAKAKGFLPTLKIATAYPYKLPTP